jgi:multiple sugar transport system substrate-binding protein
VNKRKWLKFWSLVITVAIIVISCHLLPPSTSSVSIKLSGWGGSPVEQKLLKQVLQNFETKHPQIKVKYEVISDQYMDVIKTRLIGEAAPDVFYLDALEAPFLMSKNVLEPLNNYISDEFDLQDFDQELLKIFRYQNHIYGIPKDYSTLALFYNKKALKKLGLNKPPTTWEQLLIYSRKLTGKLNRYGFGESPEISRHVYKIQAFGGKLIDKNGNATFASQAALQGLQLVIDQYRKNQTSVLPSDVGASSGIDMFGQGKVSMVIEGNWAIPYLQETFPQIDFATAEVPTINNKKGTMVYTVAYVMNKQTKHKKAAWELISYLTGKEGMEKWTGTGFALPTRKSVAQKLGYDQDYLRSALVAGVDYATPWQVGEYPAAIVNNFDNQFLSALLGEQSLKQAMLRAENNANQQIKMME